jgi:signal transduction histidine kinase
MRRKDEPEPDQIERLERELKGESPTVPGSFGRAEALSAQCRAELKESGKLELVEKVLEEIRRLPHVEGGSTPASRSSLPACAELAQGFADLHEGERRLVAEAAHELKTPLSILAGYIELLLGGKVGKLTDRQRAVLEDCAGSCARLQRFVQDLLALTRLESGRLTLKLEREDLNSCLSEVFGIWFAEFERKRIALYFPLDARLRPFQFDRVRMQQAVSNLLENAARHTPAGGSVWITAEPFHWERRSERTPHFRERRKRAKAEPNAVRVTVTDTGSGIPIEYQQEIFSDFRIPVHGDEGAGTGLGLAIVRRIVEAHQGKIWVESEVGVGTKISFLLPTTTEEER